MGAGQFGGVNIALTTMAMRNMRGTGGGGGRLPSPPDREDKESTLSRPNGETVRFKLVPYLTSGGLNFWRLYQEVDTTVGILWWKESIKKWKYINNFPSEGCAMESANHILKESRIVEL